MFKEATYQEVSRWMEKTEIAYVPNGKRAGTMSFDRYNGYAVAKTVGEALKLGSKPEDLLNDFQKGILKRTGGPKREKPLDIMAVDDATELSEVDLLLARWGYHEGEEDPEKGRKNRDFGANSEWRSKISERYKALKKVMAAKKHGIKVEQIKQGSWCETPKVQAERTRANNEAGSILEAARREGRKVRDEEVLRVLRLWTFRTENAEKIPMDTMGFLTGFRGQEVVSLPTREYPQVTQLLSQILKDNRPEGAEIDWPFTTITVQSSHTAPRHREKGVLGPAVVKLLGEFTGGRLQYWPEDDRSTKVEDLLEDEKVMLDAHGKMAVFDSRRCHSVEPYEGEERFSLAYFIANGYTSVLQETQDKLMQAGINFPTAESVEYVKNFLPAPKGHSRAKVQKISPLPFWLKRFKLKIYCLCTQLVTSPELAREDAQLFELSRCDLFVASGLKGSVGSKLSRVEL